MSSTGCISLTYAQAALLAVQQRLDADPSVLALGEDLGRGGVFGQYKGLAQSHPGRVLDTPISEAAIMGTAVGMALAGLRPVVEMRVADFALCAMDEIVNQAAKNRYMFGGQGRVPVLVRMPIGIWSASAAQHSQSFEAWYAHLPGVVVTCPSTPAQNHGLLLSALQGNDPVLHLEHKELWQTSGEVLPGQAWPFGKAETVTRGDAITLVTWSRMRHVAELAVRALRQRHDIAVELIDLVSIWPWDREAVLESCARTGRLLVVHEAVQVAGFGAEVCATVSEELGIRVARLGAPRAPVGYSAPLEAQVRISPEQIEQRVLELLKSTA